MKLCCDAMKTLTPEAIFFDLDDTLVAYDEVTVPTWRRVCTQFGGREGIPDAEPLYRIIRGTSEWYWSDPERHRTGRQDLASARRNILRLAFERHGLRNDRIAGAIADAYTVQRVEAMFLLEGVPETLETLRSRGIGLALVTNGDSEGQHAKIERFGLAGYFDAIFVEGDLGFGKPDPRVFNLALEALGAVPGLTWCVGDNLVWDVGGAQGVGIHGIWRDWRGNGLPADTSIIPDRIVRSVSELRQ